MQDSGNRAPSLVELGKRDMSVMLCITVTAMNPSSVSPVEWGLCQNAVDHRKCTWSLCQSFLSKCLE